LILRLAYLLGATDGVVFNSCVQGGEEVVLFLSWLSIDELLRLQRVEVEDGFEDGDEGVMGNVFFSLDKPIIDPSLALTEIDPVVHVELKQLFVAELIIP